MKFIYILLFKFNQEIKLNKFLILTIIFFFNINLRKTNIIFLENNREINNLKKYYELIIKAL